MRLLGKVILSPFLIHLFICFRHRLYVIGNDLLIVRLPMGVQEDIALGDFAMLYFLLHIDIHFIVAHVFTGLINAKTAHMIGLCASPTVKVIDFFRLNVVGLGDARKCPLQATFKNQIIA